MSWLVSIIISGLMTGNFGSAPVKAPAGQVTTETVQTTQTAPGDEFTERFDETYPFNPKGSIALSNINGSVTIEAWDKNEVRVEYVKTASERDLLSMVEVRIDKTKGRIEIETNYDNWKDKYGNGQNWKNRKLSVEFKLSVPRTAVLDQVETVNGSIAVSNMVNFCKVSTVNGEVTGRNLRGTANLSTVNGVVIADFDRLESGSQITLSTVNGKASVAIPSDSDATVRADTLNGTITNDFGLPIRKGQYVGRDLYGKLGNGDVRIKLSSVNGGLSLTRKQDGKSLSPATNLLPQKKKGDPDFDDDEDVDNDDDEDNKRERAAMNRDVERAVRDAVRVVPRAVSETASSVVMTEQMLKEVAKVQKEVAKSTAAQTKVIDGQVKAAMLDAQNALSGVYVLPSSSLLPAIERQGDSIPVKGTPKVIVEARNCAVIVRGWEKSEVQYSLIKISRSAPAPQNAGLNVEKDDTRVKIKVSDTNPLNRYRLELFVPRKSNLKISTDKEIRLTGVSGELELGTNSDAINVRDSGGKLTVATGNGKVRVVGFEGEVSSTTTDGMISLEGDFTKLSANTGDGTLVLTLPENAGAYIFTETENVFAEGTSLSKENGKWKVGQGGETYRIQSTPDGKVVIRSQGFLKAVY